MLRVCSVQSSWVLNAGPFFGSWPICGPGVKGGVIVTRDRFTRSEIGTPPSSRRAAFRLGGGLLLYSNVTLAPLGRDDHCFLFTRCDPFRAGFFGDADAGAAKNHLARPPALALCLLV